MHNNPVKYNDPTGHMQACADGDENDECGYGTKPENILRTYDKKKSNGDKVPSIYKDLPGIEKRILESKGYGENDYNYLFEKGVTKADPVHDPAIWVSLLPFGIRSPQLLQAGLTACYTSSICNNLFVGIQPYGEMPPQAGYERHHLVEQRFAGILGVNPKSIPSVYLTPEEHDLVTALWRQAIGYRGDQTALTTTNATINDIWNAAQSIYSQSPDFLTAARVFLFGQ